MDPFTSYAFESDEPNWLVVRKGSAPHFLDSVDRQFLCSSLRVKTAQIDERGSVAEG